MNWYAKLFLCMFLTIMQIDYPTKQKCGKHKRSRFYKDEYKIKFGLEV